MMANTAAILFIHNTVEYYALLDVIEDHKKILSFDKDLLQEVKVIGENYDTEELTVQFQHVDPAKIGITKKGIKLLRQYTTTSEFNTEHEFTLPAEIWHQIIDILAANDVWSAARCQFINKELHDITLSDVTWRNVYEDWTNSVTEPNLTHWYSRFVSEALWTRKVQLGADVISRYNQNYYCEVKAVEFTSTMITLHIDEHGDYSLGSIQDPKYSQLSTVVGSFPATTSPFHQSAFEIADPASRYLGTLSYKASYAIGGSYSFCYGHGGYAEVKLFDLTEEFIRKHKLQHIIDRWSLQFMGALSQSS